MDLLNAKGNEFSQNGSNETTVQNMAMRARAFAEINLHMEKNKSWLSCLPCYRNRECIPSRPANELVQRSGTNVGEVGFKDSSKNSMGPNTSRYYNVYLFLCFTINVLAVAFINPYFFWLPNVIACYYRKEDLTFHWSICSVPGYRYFRVAVLIVMLNHAVGIIVALLSFFYLNLFMPREIWNADAAISAYTRDPVQQEKLAVCWKESYCYYKTLNRLTSTSKFLLALIYQNIDRTLCFRLILAFVDIEKDREAIETNLPRLIRDIVKFDTEQAALINEEKEDKITEIRDTIMNPVGRSQAQRNIELVLMELVQDTLSEPFDLDQLFGAQYIHRITGVKLTKLTKEMKEKFLSLLMEKKLSEFENEVMYSRFLSAVYDLSKLKQFFTLFAQTEIGHIIGGETADHVSDNGHEVISGVHYDARQTFDTSGYCWRSSDATAYNWIRRGPKFSEDVPYTQKKWNKIIIQKTDDRKLAYLINYSYY